MNAAKKTALMAGLIVVVSVAGGGLEAQAGGYAQGFQGPQSAGVSGAVTARPELPEAGYFNPAGWALQQNWGVGGGASVIFPIIAHEELGGGERTRAEVDGAVPPFFHAFGRYRRVAGGLSLGVPYGAGLQWPEDWPGRFEVTSTSLQVLEAAPSVAWRPLDRLAIGGGPRFVWGTVGYERFIDTARPGEEGFVELSASTPGVGFQVGVWGDVHDLINLGFSWRSAITLDFEGVAEFENIPVEMEQQAHDTIARTQMVLPHRFAVGLAYEVAAMGVVSFDVEYTRWSAVESFEVRFDSEGVEDIVEDRSWENTISMRVGAEYLTPVEGLSFRSGVGFDPSPTPRATLSPASPDTDRMIMSLGAGYEAGPGLLVDFAYNFITLDRTQSGDDSFGGVYDGQIHVFTLGVRATPRR